MTATHSIEQLKSKHAELDDALEREERRVYPDDAEVTRMKKEKLKLKDQISSMEAVDAA